jgi:hypothetical protein
VRLSAPLTVPDPSPAIDGVLIYVNPAYESVIKINGNSESSYFGLIYAPNADVEVSGTGDIDDPEGVVFNTQIIGKNVHITGDALIDIVFDEGKNRTKPAYLDMFD